MIVDNGERKDVKRDEAKLENMEEGKDKRRLQKRRDGKRKDWKRNDRGGEGGERIRWRNRKERRDRNRVRKEQRTYRKGGMERYGCKKWREVE